MITTDRLNIVKFTPEEIQALMEIEHHPDNCIYIWTNTAEEHVKELEDPNVLTLAVKEKDGGRITGYVIVDLDLKSQWFEVKRIAFRDKGKGYGKETLKALIRYAFEEMHMNKVWLEAYADNKVGRSLYESLGFYNEGVRRQHSREERGLLDQIQYSILKDEYTKLKEQGVLQ